MRLILFFWINDHKESFVQCSLDFQHTFWKVCSLWWQMELPKKLLSDEIVGLHDLLDLWSKGDACSFTIPVCSVLIKENEKIRHVGNVLFQFQTPWPILKLNRWSYSNAKTTAFKSVHENMLKFSFIKILDKACPDSNNYFLDKII